MPDAILEIQRFAAGRTREDLGRDRLLLLALVKDIEIIGEAAGRVSPETRAAWPEIPWQDIVATRNRLIHGYFDIDASIVWSTISEDLPPLAAHLEAALSSPRT